MAIGKLSSLELTSEGAAWAGEKITVGVLAFTVFIFAHATSSRGAVPTAVLPAALPAAAAPPGLSQPQWDRLFRTEAKTVSTLRLRVVIHSSTYLGRAQARSLNDLSRRRTAVHPQVFRVGYTGSTSSVSLRWDVPTSFLRARKIGAYGASKPQASILVCGRRSVWHAIAEPSGWRVDIYRRSSAPFVQRWRDWRGSFGLAVLENAWTPLEIAYGSASGDEGAPSNRRLISQRYDPSTGLVKLVYACLRGGEAIRAAAAYPRWGMKGLLEARYRVGVNGGLRVYRKALDVVDGSKHTPMYEMACRRFRKSHGIWFPTRIRYRVWVHMDGSNRLYSDTRLKISRLSVNSTFPPGTFRYVPPFGAQVYDMRREPTSVYFVGSKNPNVPPATLPAGGRRGSGAK